MIYDIRHLTTYEYASSVAFSHCALRLLPIAGPGQRVIDTSIEIAPRPVEMAERTCFFGNRVTSITIESPHRVLTIDTRSTVDVQRAPPPNALATPLRTGDVRVALESGWATPGQICIQQDNPLPCQVLALIPEFLPGDTPQVQAAAKQKKAA